MKPYRLKKARLQALEARKASMSPGNGQTKELTPEQIASQIAQQRMMAAAYAAQQRQAMATALLSGILSGLYSNPELLEEHFGDKAVNDAVAFADRLQKRLLQDAQAQLKASQPSPPHIEPEKVEPAKAANDAPTGSPTPPAAAGES
jgi:hypothetical protein